MAKTQVNPVTSTIREFLENVLDRDWFHLVYANPKAAGLGGMGGYVTDSVDDAVDWLLDQNERKRGCYYAVNSPPRTQSKKAKKADLRWLNFLHVDVDIPKTMRRDDSKADDYIADRLADIQGSRLVKGKPFIIASGNGVQGLWPLATPLKATPDNIARVEAINRRLAAAFGGDNCHNADRVLRVPGLVNYPDAGKRARGFTPVLATLVASTRDVFELADFDGLPQAETVTKARRTLNRTDYTQLPYARNYTPFTFEDFFQTRPDIASLMEEKLADHGDDRSPAALSFLHHTVTFFMNELDCSAVDLLDDVDVMRNMAELFLDGASLLSVLDDIVSRYYDNENGFGLGNLGYDIEHALDQAADDHRKATLTSQKQARERKKGTALAKLPLAEVGAHEAWQAVMTHIRGALSGLDQLPNFREKAAHQLATQANLKTILDAAGVVARWDAMRDQARFHIRADAGAVGEEGRPALYWERALAHVAEGKRARREESLLCDALANFGITARKELPALLQMVAEDNMFHPLEDYCKARKWDGLGRIAELAKCVQTDHPLAEVYLRQHFRCCIAAIKSMRHHIRTGDGLQIDTAVVLDGAQGIGKSSFWVMVTPDGFMSKGSSLRLGQHGEADSKRECLAGLVTVLNEIGHTLDRSTADSLKEFRASRSDEFRVSFGRVPISKPRMTVLCGTSNDLQLRDHTGSRRDLVLGVTGFDWPAIEALLDDGGLQQIYAEAWHEVMVEDRVWWLSKDEEAQRAAYNDGYRQVSEDEERIASYLSHLTPAHQDKWLNATHICDLLRIRYNPNKWTALKEVLVRNGCEFRDQVYRKGNTKLRRVFLVPILPDQYKIITGG